MSVSQSQGDGYDLDFDSDDNRCSSSSEDEIHQFMHGTPEQKRKIRKKMMNRSRQSSSASSSSEDEFEKMMSTELDKKVEFLEDQRGEGHQSTPKSNKPTTSKTKDDDEFLEQDDSDQGDDNDLKLVNMTNDELLYDPNMDDEDQKWVDKQRQSYQTNSQHKKLPNSDAVLNCPACMTTLCLDCQRHSLYKNQYRAMFVMNCKVDQENVLKYPEKSKDRKRKNDGTLPPGGRDIDYNPVHCTECKTQVAVFDKDEVFHFFNVLASYG